MQTFTAPLLALCLVTLGGCDGGGEEPTAPADPPSGNDPAPAPGTAGSGAPTNGSAGNTTPTPTPATPAGPKELTAMEKLLVGSMVGPVISGKEYIYVFNADRTGCYFRRYLTGERVDFAKFSGWSLDEASDRKTDNGMTMPLVYTTASGNTYDADMFNLALRQVWPSGHSNIALDRSDASYTCTKQ